MDEIKLELFPTADNSNKIEEVKPPKAAYENVTPPPMKLSSLSTNEQAMVRDFMSQIDITDSNLVITYGSTPQNKIAQFSDSVLENVKTKDLGEAGKLLTDLVVEIRNFDKEGGEEKKGLAKFFSGTKKSFDKMAVSYSRTETNIERISASLEGQKRQLLKDIEIFDAMYENNLNYFKELSLYLIAGNEKLNEINNVTLPKMKAKAEAGGEIDAQRYNDMVSAANRFEKKLHDLNLSRTISLQMAPQIRLIQNNDAQLVDKIQSSLVNSIPLWKNQMVIALGLANSRAALESQKRVTDMTNELLRRNSEMLKVGSLEVARESEEGIVSIDTIKKTNQDLLETIYGIIEIQQKGREDRILATQELEKIEGELKEALLATKRK